MIFQHPTLLAKVLDGSKTQTRRMAYLDRDALSIGIGSIVHAAHRRWEDCEIARVYRGDRLLWHVGGTYTVQPGRGERRVGFFLLDVIRYVDCAWTLTTEDAIAEGFEGVSDWRKAYADLNGGIHSLDLPCWKLVFHLAMEARDE